LYSPGQFLKVIGKLLGNPKEQIPMGSVPIVSVMKNPGNETIGQ
jgi:hypothetical protein